MSELVTYTSNGKIAHITLNRAEKLNALSNELVRQLRDQLEAFQASEDRVAVLSALTTESSAMRSTVVPATARNVDLLSAPCLS